MKTFKYPKVIDNQTLVTNNQLFTKYIPCLGAKAIHFLVYGNGGGAPQPCTWIGSGTGSGGFFNPAGTNLLGDGVSGHVLSLTNPMPVVITVATGVPYMGWPYITLRLVAAVAGPDVPSVTVDAWVVYENETDKLYMGQDGLLPV